MPLWRNNHLSQKSTYFHLKFSLKKFAQMLKCSNTLAKSTFFSINRGTFISNFSTLTVHSISYFCHCKLHLIFTATHFVSCATFNSCTLIRTPFDTSIAKFISIATSNIQFSSITLISDFHWDLHKKSNFMLQTRKFSFHFIPSLQLRSSLLRFGMFHRLSHFVLVNDDYAFYFIQHF